MMTLLQNSEFWAYYLSSFLVDLHLPVHLSMHAYYSNHKITYSPFATSAMVQAATPAYRFATSASKYHEEPDVTPGQQPIA